jgi:hypothetical protein
MNEEAARDLRRCFGYAPNEQDGEKWTVYQNEALIVIHPARRPRIYHRQAMGPDNYIEIDPLPF